MPITVTANLEDLSGASNAGSAIFTLVGYGDSIPSTDDVLISAVTVKSTADDEGAISQDVIGNDDITPEGTSYTVEIYSDEGSFISIARYRFTGSDPIDLSSLTPLPPS